MSATPTNTTSNFISTAVSAAVFPADFSLFIFVPFISGGETKIAFSARQARTRDVPPVARSALGYYRAFRSRVMTKLHRLEENIGRVPSRTNDTRRRGNRVHCGRHRNRGRALSRASHEDCWPLS